MAFYSCIRAALFNLCLEQCFDDLEHKAVLLRATLEVTCTAALDFLPTSLLSTVFLGQIPVGPAVTPLPTHATSLEGARTLTVPACGILLT